ncbi:MAG: SusD/RagB family nutrient-binding outer membrane lipoprotein [Bacteroidia bacterium]|nr:SusD/RagB family nutrient-binding outer membrane lipoprotein [Bacteroidia bacterium]
MKKTIYILIVCALTSMISCDRGFEELNKNPLLPTEVNFGALFNEMVNSLRLGWNRQLFLHNEILYDVTELGVVTASTFGNVDAGAEDVWQNYYYTLQNSRQLEKLLDDLTESDLEASNVIKAQIKILMAYKTFQLLDLFGDIPYSEAGKAYEEDAIERPAYDDGKEVYLSLLEDLEFASEYLINLSAKTSLGNDFLRLGMQDALFADNLSMWAKFSNSLLLKYLVRIYDQEPQLVDSGVQKILGQGYELINPGEDVLMLPSAQAWSNLGVNWSFREHNKLRMGSTLWNLFTENGEIVDPRIHIFFEPNNEGEWIPFPQVQPSNIPQSGGAPYQKDIRDNAYSNKGEGNIYSPFNFYLTRDEQDIPEILMTAAEVKFILAEIFLRGIGSPKDEFISSFRYQEGMLTSMEFWQNIALNSSIWQNQPPILNFGELFAVSENAKYKFELGGEEEANLGKIYTQRWVDYFRQPWEAFVMSRLTDLIPREKPANEFFRFQYPVSEVSLNFDNWNVQQNKMGGDETHIKLWWME